MHFHDRVVVRWLLACSFVATLALGGPGVTSVVAGTLIQTDTQTQTQPPVTPPQTTTPPPTPPAASTDTPASSGGSPADSQKTPDKNDKKKDDAAKSGVKASDNTSHIFGVLPNYTSVGRGQIAPPLTTKATFSMAADGAFDKVVFPFTAFTAAVAQLEHQEPEWGYSFGAYAKRYGMGFADNTLASFMTTAVAPTLFRQDPRYFVMGEGGRWHRALYALSRTVVTESRSGHAQFNFSDIVGNGVAAEIMNTYHPVEDRTLSETLNRWGMQILYDTITDMLKEFWPDIHHYFHKH